MLCLLGEVRTCDPSDDRGVGGGGDAAEATASPATPEAAATAAVAKTAAESSRLPPTPSPGRSAERLLEHSCGDNATGNMPEVDVRAGLERGAPVNNCESLAAFANEALAISGCMRCCCCSVLTLETPAPSTAADDFELAPPRNDCRHAVTGSVSLVGCALGLSKAAWTQPRPIGNVMLPPVTGDPPRLLRGVSTRQEAWGGRGAVADLGDIADAGGAGLAVCTPGLREPASALLLPMGTEKLPPRCASPRAPALAPPLRRGVATRGAGRHSAGGDACAMGGGCAGLTGTQGLVARPAKAAATAAAAAEPLPPLPRGVATGGGGVPCAALAAASLRNGGGCHLEPTTAATAAVAAAAASRAAESCAARSGLGLLPPRRQRPDASAAARGSPRPPAPPGVDGSSGASSDRQGPYGARHLGRLELGIPASMARRRG